MKTRAALRFMETLAPRSTQHLPTIGICGITIPGAADCFAKIGVASDALLGMYRTLPIVVCQGDFSKIHAAQECDDWDAVAEKVLKTLTRLERAGADFAIIPANTIHLVLEQLQAASPLPILSMLDVVTTVATGAKVSRLIVMGTRWTMSPASVSLASCEGGH